MSLAAAADPLGVTAPLGRLAVAAAASLALGVNSAHTAPSATCHGLPVTLVVDGGAATATPGADVIRMTGPATVRAGAGPDIICGSAGPDRIDAGSGDDVVLGAGGDDTIRAGAGRDHVYGEGGADRIRGGPQADVLVPGGGRDRVSAATADVVQPGRYAVSVHIPDGDLRDLIASRRTVAVSRPAPGGPPRSLIPVWATFRPRSSTALSWSDVASAYAHRIALRPASVVRPLTVSGPAAGEVAWTLTADGFTSAPWRGLGARTFVIINQRHETTVAGLAQAWSAGAETRVTAVSAVGLSGHQAMEARMPVAVAVFTTDLDLQGLLLEDIPSDAAVVEPTPAAPTATVLWSSATGSFTAAPR